MEKIQRAFKAVREALDELEAAIALDGRITLNELSMLQVLRDADGEVSAGTLSTILEEHAVYSSTFDSPYDAQECKKFFEELDGHGDADEIASILSAFDDIKHIVRNV